MKRLLIFFLVLLGLLSGINADTVYFNQSNSVASVTNNSIWTSGFTIAGGWTTLSTSQFAFTPSSSNYNRGARFTITDTALANGEILNISFTNYQTHDRFNNINLYDNAGTSGIGFERSTGAGTPYIGIRNITSSSYVNWNTINAELTYYSNGIKDTSAITYNFLWNGTHGKLIRNGVTDINWTSIKTLKNITKVEVFTQSYQTGTDIISNLVISKYSLIDTTPYLNFTSISLINNTYFNTSSIQINTTVLNTSTNSNVNQTYYLYYNNGTLINSTQYATNNLNGYINLSGLSDNTYKVYFYARNNETNVTTGNYTFTIDTNAPTINNNILSSYPGYNVNFNSSCTDTNLNYCNISINGQNKALNTTSFNFTTNGNQSYNITAVDLAGNSATTSGVTLINPIQYLRPYDNLRSLYLTNYYIDGVLYSNYYNFSLFNFGYGNHSVNFSKEGYTNTTFDFSLNTTSALNSTYNVTPITFTLKAYDINSPTTQLYFNLTISNATNSTYYLNQYNFSKYYNETLTGDLTLIVESSGFDLVKLYTAFSPYTAVSQIVYLNNLSVPVIYRVLDISLQQPIEDVVLNVYSQINGSQTFIGQAKTDSQGFTYFNQDTSRDYYITFTKSGYVTQQINSLPGVVEYTVLMPEDGADAGFIFNGLSYKFSPTAGTITDLPFNGSVTVIDEDSLISSLIFTISGTNYTNSTSDITSPNGGVYTLYVNNASTQYLFNLTIVREGQTYTFTKTYNYLQESNETTTLINVAEQLNSEEYNGEKIFIIMFIYIGFMALGAFFSPTLGVMFGIFPLMLFAFVGWIPDGVAILLGFFNVLGALYFRG